MKIPEKMKNNKSMIKLLYFPVIVFYMEIVFHLYLKMNMKYMFLFGGFAFAIGMLLSLLTIRITGKIEKIITGIITGLLALAYGAEVVCKDILQQFYPLFSALDTAAGNHLEDYGQAILGSLAKNWMVLILLIVIPFAAYIIFIIRVRQKKMKIKRKRKWMLLTCIRSGILFAVLLVVIQIFPWKGDITPDKICRSDTNINEQIEQLGLFPMVFLDGKHALFGAKGETISQEELEQLVVQENEAAKDTNKDQEAGAYEENPIDTSPNALDIDFQKLIDESSNDDVKWLSQYFSSMKPTNKNKYTGMFEGYNVIFITAEGFSGYMIDKDLTPTLYRLTHEGFVFNNFYSALHFTSTSGGEFQNLTGLYPKNGFPISMTETGKQGTYLPFTLGNILSKNGYTSTGYHYNTNMYGREKSHPNLGYNWRQVTECKDPVSREKNETGEYFWPQSDDYMIRDSVDDYVGEEPFHTYYLTISGHLPYSDGGNAMSKQNKELVADLPYDKKTKAYLAANLELEKALATLINELEKAGVADKTLLVMAPDHIPYADIDVLEDLAGKSFGVDSLESIDESKIDFDVYKNSLIMWSASMKESVEVDKVCCQVDILPTILNLLGLEYDSRLLSGTDILSDSEGLVVFLSGSWKTDKGMYNANTGTFTPKEGASFKNESQEDYVNRIKTMVKCRRKIGQLIIENDYYRLLFPE